MICCKVMGDDSPEVLNKLGSLAKMLERKYIDENEFNLRKRSLLDEAGYGSAASAKKPKLAPPSFSVRLTDSDECSDSDNESNQSSLKGSANTNKSQGDQKRRRLKKSATAAEAIAKHCRPKLWLDKKDGSIVQHVVPLEYVNNKDEKALQWKVDEDGFYSCAVCRAKTKGTKLDPNSAQRVDSKMLHNVEKGHINRLVAMVQVPGDAVRFISWRKEDEKYIQSKEHYEKLDASARSGDNHPHCDHHP